MKRNRLASLSIAVAAALATCLIAAPAASAEGAPTKSFVQIVNNGSPHLCLDSLHGVVSNGTPAVIYKCAHTTTQYWRFFPTRYKKHRVFRIRQNTTGQCLTRKPGHINESVYITRCTGTHRQLWTQGTNVFDGGQDIMAVPNWGQANLVPHIKKNGTVEEKSGARLELSQLGGDIDNSWSYRKVKIHNPGM